MKRTTLIVVGLVAVLSVYLVWRLGFAVPAPGMTGSVPTERPRPQPRPAGPDANGTAPAPVRPQEVNEPNRPRPFPGLIDVNAFAEGMMRRRMGRGGFGDFGGFGGPGQDRSVIAEANDPNALEALNLNNVQMRDIIERIAAWTGKVVIPVGEAMQQRVTIYAPKRVPRKEAILLIYSALRTQGYTVEDANNVLYIKPLTAARTGTVPTIPEDQPLAAIENKEQVVQRFFKLKNYSPTDMATLLQPLIGEYGYVSSDLTTNTLLIIDTVANLIKIERIILELDVPEAGQTISEVIQLQFADPVEVVQLLQLLLGSSSSTTTGTRSVTSTVTGGVQGGQRGQFGGPMGQFGRGGPGMRGQPGGQQSIATMVTIGGARMPVVLIPEPTRRWIIVRATAQDLATVKEWVAKLDREDTVKAEYESVQLIYADAQEVATQIEQMLAQGGTLATQVRPNVIIRPLTQTKQVVIYGRADLRDMIKGMIAKIDIPAGDYIQKTFQLRYADPDTIKQNLDNLYGQTITTSAYYRGYSTAGRTSSDVVKVTSLPSLGQVTVIASPENIKKIEQQIQQWDAPMDVDKVKPRIIELRNSDPVQMADLMKTLFSEDSTSSTTQALRALIYGSGETAAKGKIVGPLYGQLTFESVPGTRKIIVISKVPEAYDVVEQLIRELDRQEMAEVPRVVTLKYADPEKLAELLNALFSETGTRATITLGATGLSAYSMTGGSTSTTGTSTAARTTGTTGTGGTTAAGQYTPWWTSARTSTTEQPISNVIGKVRFIPDAHSKSILVLAPPEFQDDIEQTIHQLDVPGQQVMVKAVVVEVSHSGATSLGVQLATNPNAFGTLDENALMAINQLIWLDKGGSPMFTTNTTSTGTTFNTTANAMGTENATIFTGSINILLDFLVKRVNAKILNQQTLWTKDNEEAMFFKGDNVAFSTGATVSATVGATQNFEFQRVGMTLRVRPRITPEKNVDMVINVILSDLTSELVNSQPKRTEMETTTNMIVQNGQTVMLGGILFQKNSNVLRKVALLGDIPIIGEAFRHREIVQANSEMIIFVTPYVVSEGEGISENAQEQMRGPLDLLKQVREKMESDRQQLLKPIK